MDQEKPSEGTVRRKRSQVFLFLRDAGFALAFVVLLLVAMFAYTGLWPPLVVVESDSMMHGPDNTSHIGTIDTGDLVLVKKVGNPGDIGTYMHGRGTGHKTYGDYGDVIIYRHMGSTTRTPIIHRAMIYLQVNEDGKSYRSEDLRNAPGGSWSAADPNNSWANLTSDIVLYNVGYDHQAVSIPIQEILQNFARSSTIPTSGYVTKGDHNTDTDLDWSGLAPVRFDWIVGKARGEIPWFGLLKLWSSGTLKTPAPENSVRDLWITIALIVISPIVVDIVLTYRERRGITRKRAEKAAAEKEDAGKENLSEDDPGPEEPPNGT